MNAADSRIKAQILRTENSETYQEYRVDDISYPTADVLQAALEAR